MNRIIRPSTLLLIVITVAIISAAAVYLIRALDKDEMAAPDSPSTSASASQTREQSQTFGRPELLPLALENDTITAIASTRGQELAFGTESGRVYLTTLPKIGQGHLSPITELPARIQGLAASQDGQTIAALSSDRNEARVLVLARSDNRDPVIIPVDALEADTIALSPSGDRLVVAAFNVQIYDTRTGRSLASVEIPPPAGGSTSAEDIAFNRNGDVVLINVEGFRTVRLSNEPRVGDLVTCDCAANSAELDPLASQALFGTASGHLVIFAVDTGDLLVDTTVAADGSEHIFSVVTNQAGDRAIAATTSGRFLVWDLRNSQPVGGVQHFPNALQPVVYLDGDSTLLLASSNAGDVTPEPSYWLVKSPRSRD
jgi:WD40 repeat protein